MNDQALPSELNPEKIGGWLVLVGLGVVLGPLVSLFSILTTYPPIFNDGTWEVLTTRGSDSYIPFFGPFLIIELVVNAALLLAAVYLAVLFFSRRSVFPFWYGGLCFFSAVFILVDSIVVSWLLQGESTFDKEIVRQLLKSLIGLFVWTPYLFISKRAKATFVH